MDISLSVERIKHWGVKGGMAIVDQGIFSGSNFILNIVLARWLFPEDYGAYAIGFTVLVLFLQLLISYILEPMGVLGPSSHRENLKAYLMTQLRLYFVASVPIGLLFASVAYLYGRFGGNPLVCNILVAIGITLSPLLLPWMLRRIFYVLDRPDIAVLGSIVYAISLIVSVFIMRQLAGLTGISSVFMVALAGLISGLFLLNQLTSPVIPRENISLLEIFQRNWTFGRWLIVSSVLMVASVQAQIYITGSFLGLKESGVLYALQSLSQPMTLTITAITGLITPSLAADYARSDLKSFKRKAYSMSIAW